MASLEAVEWPLDLEPVVMAGVSHENYNLEGCGVIGLRVRSSLEKSCPSQTDQ